MTNESERTNDDARIEFESLGLEVLQEGVKLLPDPPLLFGGHQRDDNVTLSNLCAGGVEPRVFCAAREP